MILQYFKRNSYELQLHLQTYNAVKMITVGEDATRVITKVDYDNETNRLVGFVLPCDDNGLPHSDSFLLAFKVSTCLSPL